MKITLKNAEIKFEHAIVPVLINSTGSQNGIMTGTGSISGVGNWNVYSYDVSSIDTVNIDTIFGSGSVRIWVLKSSGSVVASGELITETGARVEESVTGVDVSAGDTLYVNAYTYYGDTPKVWDVSE